MTEMRYEAGQRGAKPHVHHRQTDAFYVLEGTVVFDLGPEPEPVQAAAGSFVVAPPGVVHGFRNDGARRARFLDFHIPGERFPDYLRAIRAGEDRSWFDQFDPPADGGRPLADATVRGPGEGERLEVARSSVVLKGTGDETDGMFFLAETTIEPGFPGPPPHVHRELHDMFYVAEGALTVRIRDETVQAQPGAFVCVPPGVVHAFSNPSERPARFLNFNTPAGWENYMRDLARALSGERPPKPDEIGAIASRYDFDAL